MYVSQRELYCNVPTMVKYVDMFVLAAFKQAAFGRGLLFPIEGRIRPG